MPRHRHWSCCAGAPTAPPTRPLRAASPGERAAAVRDYLVAAGVDPARIRATYQPAGDHVADNASAGGRNREPARRDRAVPRAAGRCDQRPPCPNPPSLLPTHLREVAMDADNSPSVGSARPGRHVEPANRATWPRSGSRRRSDTAGERYEMRDPIAEVTYRSRTPSRRWSPRPISSAAPLRRGSQRTQAHVGAEGGRRVAAGQQRPAAPRAAAGPAAGAR
jgi:hypothetical protein